MSTAWFAFIVVLIFLAARGLLALLSSAVTLISKFKRSHT